MVEDPAESPLDQEDEEVAASAADDSDAFLSVMPHFYRGEISQAISAQDRIDRTTNWAITMLIALLSVVFSSRSLPAYLLLIGLIALGVFRSSPPKSVGTGSSTSTVPESDSSRRTSWSRRASNTTTGARNSAKTSTHRRTK